MTTHLMDASRQWASRPADERFTSLTDLHASCLSRMSGSREHGMVPMSALNVSPIGDDIQLDNIGTFNHWSMSQLAAKLAAPREFLSRLPAQIVSTALNHLLGKSNDESNPLLMDGRIRAFTGGRYNRLWDAEVTTMLQKSLPAGWRNPVAFANGEWGAELVPSGLYASDRDMFAFFISGGDLIDLGDNDQLHRGIFVYNSEVGKSSFGFSTFYFRMCCGNNIVWDASDVQRVRAYHTKGVRKAFDMFEFALYKLAREPMDDSFVAAVRKAKSLNVAALNTDEEKLIDVFDFTNASTVLAARDRILVEELNATGTAWNWLQGFTSVARALPHVDSRLKLERDAASNLLK